jgi:hypothetical protein
MVVSASVLRAVPPAGAMRAISWISRFQLEYGPSLICGAQVKKVVIEIPLLGQLSIVTSA